MEFIKNYSYLIFIPLCVVITFILFAGEGSPFYRLASTLLGFEPTDGDGAFQYPIGWVLMLITGVALGALIAFLFSKFA